MQQSNNSNGQESSRSISRANEELPRKQVAIKVAEIPALSKSTCASSEVAKSRLPSNPSSTKPSSNETWEQWIHRTISTVLSFTLNFQDQRGYMYSDKLRQELKDESSVEEPNFPDDDLDRCILALLSLQLGTSPFNYLVDCYRRADILLRALPKAQDSQRKSDLLTSLKTLCVSYAGLSVNIPEILEATHPSPYPDIIQRLLVDDSEDRGLPRQFLWDLVENLREDDSLQNFFDPVFAELSQSLQSTNLGQNFYPWFNALSQLIQHQGLAVAFTQSELFIPAQATPESYEKISLLGPFFRISPIDPIIAKDYFAGASDQNPSGVASSINSLRASSATLQTQLFAITNTLIRSSADTRNATLKYFATALNLNKKKHALRVDASTVATDGYMVNITSVLNRLSEPFMSDQSKMSKIDVEYLRQEPLIDLTDETRLAADMDSSAHYYGTRMPGASNFISQVFFLNVACHHYGLGAAMSTHEKLLDRIRDLSKYHDQLQAEQPFQGPQAMMMTLQFQRMTTQLEQAKAMSHTYVTLLCDESSQSRSFSFLSLVASWLIRLVDPTHQYPYKMIDLPLQSLEQATAWSNLPEYFVEDIAEFFLYISKFIPTLLSSAPVTELVIFSLVFLRASKYIKNPYLKAKLVEILFHGVRSMRGNSQGALGAVLNSHPFALLHLFPALMSFYIEAESTGLSTQFYDKFNIRYHISQIFQAIWENPAHRERLELESKNDIEFFVRFVALLLNDQTYLLDEALSKLTEIHNLQAELEENNPTTESNEARERRQHLGQSQRAATSYLQLGSETLTMLNLFTKSIPEAFCTPEIVERLATMLDYNVDALVGPKCSGLKVRNPEKYHFDPKALLSGIVGIFLNMKDKKPFVTAVAKDGRSYKRENFVRTAEIIMRYAVRSSADIDALMLFVEDVEKRKIEYEQDEEDLGEIPDEFLDPIIGDIMSDPVTLPSSKAVMDRSTIKRHLLNDMTDPFNRAPLTLEDVVPNMELKAQIESFKASRRRA